jgi:hypothetical protein
MIVRSTSLFFVALLIGLSTSPSYASDLISCDCFETSAFTSSISGGVFNIAKGQFSSISGGRNNSLSAQATSVSGGSFNTASVESPKS